MSLEEGSGLMGRGGIEEKWCIRSMMEAEGYASVFVLVLRLLLARTAVLLDPRLRAMSRWGGRRLQLRNKRIQSHRRMTHSPRQRAPSSRTISSTWGRY